MSKDFDGKTPNSNLENAQNSQGDEVSLLSVLQTNDKIPFHMPGHKRNDKFGYLLGTEKIDVTEIDGTDNLHDANGVLKSAMEFAAGVYGVKETRFLVNGSTCGILAGMRTLAKRGDTVLVARNCHKSVYNAVELLGLVSEYIMPEFLEEYGIYASIAPNTVDELLSKTGAKLVVITSPTYEGILSDVKAISDVCHTHGATLFVDEAHGAHLGLDSHFEKSARELGADLVVNSLHKTMPSLTQTAVIHVCSDRVDIRRLEESLAIFETSSPSYVLMSSIDECVRYTKHNPEMLYKWAMRVFALRDELSRFDNVKLLSREILSAEDSARVFKIDETKLVFLLGDSSLTGVEFSDKLQDAFGIELEMAAKDYAIAMTGAGDTKEMYSALSAAVGEIDKSAKPSGASGRRMMNANFAVLPQKAFNQYQIDGLSVEPVNMLDSIGRVSAENVWAYPPGAPILVKGEIMSKDTAELLVELLRCGVNLSSSLRDFPDRIFVVKE